MPPSIVKRFVSSPLARNRFGLYAKYCIDRLLGNKKYLVAGRTIKKTSSRIHEEKPQTILFPTVFFLERGLTWQTTIAKALEIRGHKVIFMPLDISFPTRNSLYFDETGERFMSSYYNLYTRTLLKSFDFTIKPYSTFGSAKEFQNNRKLVEAYTWEECENFEYEGISIGRLVINQLIHYFRCGPHQHDAHVLVAYKDFLAIAMVLTKVIDKAYSALHPDTIFTLNGSFIDSSLQIALAKKHNMRVITFEAGFMLNALMLGINEPIIDFPMKKYLPSTYDSYTLTPDQNTQLDEYLKTRSLGKDCIFDYWGNPIFDVKKIRDEIGLPEGVTPDILFTNLLWDSTTVISDIAFTSQQEWIFTTIRYYVQHPERTLLIRIHPAEIVPPALESSVKMAEVIANEFPTLPKNVIVIPPTSTVSSYPLTELSDLTLVHASTAGMEAATMGKNVVVSGLTHYRGMRFTYDVHNREEYLRLLETRNFDIPTETIRMRARKYAYFFFFGFMIPFPLVIERSSSVDGDQVSFNYTSQDELLPGKSAELDFIIDVILGNKEYSDRLKTLLTNTPI